jgi:ABC-type sulfate transport system substrate-binding protein
MNKLHKAINLYALTISLNEQAYIHGRKNIRIVYINYMYVNHKGELKTHYNYIVTEHFTDEYIKTFGDIVL